MPRCCTSSLLLIGPQLALCLFHTFYEIESKPAQAVSSGPFMHRGSMAQLDTLQILLRIFGFAGLFHCQFHRLFRTVAHPLRAVLVRSSPPTSSKKTPLESGVPEHASSLHGHYPGQVMAVGSVSSCPFSLASHDPVEA